MKQNIECSECGPKWRTLLRSARVKELGNGRTSLVKHYPDTGEEVVTLQAGTARQLFKCDHCGEPIEKGADCFAVGVYAADAGIADIPGWEQAYIRLPACLPKIHGHDGARGVLLFIAAPSECDGQPDDKLEGWTSAVVDHLEEAGLRLTPEVADASVWVEGLVATARDLADTAAANEESARDAEEAARGWQDKAAKAEEAARLAQEEKKAWQHKGANAEIEARQLRRELGEAGKSVDVCHQLLIAMREAGVMDRLDRGMVERVAEVIASDMEETQELEVGAES